MEDKIKTQQISSMLSKLALDLDNGRVYLEEVGLVINGNDSLDMMKLKLYPYYIAAIEIVLEQLAIEDGDKLEMISALMVEWKGVQV